MVRSVLLVEDDPDIRLAYADVCEAMGLQVLMARHGGEALAVLEQHGRVGLILLDLMMPVMDGYQFRAVQLADPRWETIPVVVLSANPPDKSTRALGVVDHLQKPVGYEDLVSVFTRYFGPPAV